MLKNIVVVFAIALTVATTAIAASMPATAFMVRCRPTTCYPA